MTSDWIDPSTLDSGYWYRNLRLPVRLDEVIARLIDEGYSAFVECSPHPVLTVGVEQRAEVAGRDDVLAVGTLRRDQDGLRQFYSALGQAWVGGVTVDWSRVLPDQTGGEAGLVGLPTYAFQHQRFWPSEPVWSESAAATGSEGDNRFWAAIEQEDLPALSNTLQADDEQRNALESVLPVLSSWRRRQRETSTVDGWRYRVTWKKLPEAASTELVGTWLVVAPAGEGVEWAEAIGQAMTDQGARVVPVELDPTTDRAGIAARLAAAVADVPAPAGVLSLLALATGSHPTYSAVPAGYAGTVALVQALGDAAIDAPLWVVSRGAVSTGPADPVTEPIQALVWGLGPVVGQEHPQRWGGLVDLPSALDRTTLTRLAALLATADTEDQLVVRANGVHARRLAHANPDVPPLPGAGWRPRGTVLVTGGTGALGAHVARWLARHGAEHLLLTSRRGMAAPGAEELVAELTESGAAVTVSTVDLADRDALAELLAGIPAEQPLTTVVHTAAALDDALLADLSVEQIDHVLRVKVESARNLAELTEELELSAFVLFSSFGGMFGAAGQGNYAPGNAFVDALARTMRARGRRATAIMWGHWAAGGMATGAVEERMFQRGVPAMAPELALSALQRVLDNDETSAVVVDIDWARVVAVSGRPSSLFQEIPEVRRLVAESSADQAGAGQATPESLTGRLARLSAAEREQTLLELVRAQVAAVLGYDSAALVDADRAFKDLGFDSVTAVELRNRLQVATELRLPATLVFDYPTPVVLARHMAGEIAGGVVAPAAPVVATRPVGDEPIAIVAMSCRFPGGVNSPEQLWQLLVTGGDAITGFPTDRGWDVADLYHGDPDQPGKTYVREGGFLHDVALFDSAFFGISPREALAMDPQQRLLLEVCWEAFERAGIRPGSVRGSQIGVFVGASSSSYGTGVREAPEGTEGHLLTGTAMSVVAGRLAYNFGVEGPAVTVDTACSSSLVALHLAAQSLRAGECSLALAGGVTVMASPAPFVLFSRQRGLAADGRCKPFSDAADGMGMAEGVGMFLVERLSDAQRNGHQVLAVLRGSAVNQDGASNGLTAPNGPSQQRVIRAALANAGLTASDVDAVEAHGTGTTLGDPIEAQALLATYGQDRPAERPLWIGSVKSNIGHTQSAAGAAGVMKMVLGMRHGRLPKTLHLDVPSQHVDWDSGAVELLTEARDWPETGQPRRAGVSSFGVSGTNAHVILEQAPAPVEHPDETPVTEPAAVAWPLSGRTPGALRAQAAELVSHVRARSELTAADIGLALATTRETFEHRAVLVGRDRAELVERLATLAEDGSGPGLVRGVAGEAGKVVFVFPGQGSQWLGMGRELLETSPVFAERMRECQVALAEFVDWSLVDVLRSDVELDRVDVVQPVLFAVLVSLAEVWRSHGVRPAAVIGHSQGEIAAACVAGALTLSDAARVVALRSQALLALSGQGGMVSIPLGRDEVTTRLERWAGRLSVAAVNGPNSVVVSGDAEAVAELLAECAADGVRAKQVPVDYASHSAHVEQIEGQLLAALAPIQPRAARIPFYSTVTGDLLDTTGLDAAYWYRNLRQTVEFERVTALLVEHGHGVFVECSPHPVLTVGVEETVERAGATGVAVGTLRRDDGGLDRVLLSLAELATRGVAVDWASVFAGSGARPVELPTYAFQRQRYWLDFTTAAGDDRESGEAGGTGADAGFWAAVEEQDVRTLADTLEVDGAALDAVLPALSRWRREQHAESTVDGWRYRVTWEPVAEPEPATPGGRWLLVVPAGCTEQDWVRAAVDALDTGQVRAVPVALADTELDRAVLAERLTAAVGDEPVTGVVSLLAAHEAELAGWPGVPIGASLTLVLMQALGDAGVHAPLWCLTRGAVAVADAETPSSAVQSQVWGLGRVVGLEQPHRWGGLVDLPEVVDERAAARLRGVLFGQSGEDQVAIRPAGLFGRRLVRAAIGGDAPASGTWQARGTVLVTGATGALGPIIARWLAGNGAEHLVLTSRRGAAAPGMAELSAELTAAGVRVTVAACDVADRAALAELVRQVEADGGPIRAVVHAAALIRLVSLAKTTVAEFAEVVSAKVAGATNLDEIFDRDDLDAFVLFSSIAGIWGSGDHGAYAAAAAFLDALAEQRRARGRVATSIAWGVWDALHRMDDGQVVEDMMDLNPEWHGLSPMDPELGMRGMGRALDLDDTVVAVADVDWERFTAAFTSARPSPLLTGLPEVRRLLTAEAAEPDRDAEDVLAALRERLTDASPVERHRIVLDLVRTKVAEVLGHASASAIDPDKAFQELGFDSLTAVDLRNRLNASTGLRLPTTLVFDHPNATVLTGHVLAELLPQAGTSVSGLDELDRLEAALAIGTVDDGVRTEITLRLRSLLSRWTEGMDHAEGGSGERDLGTATDDELFGVLDELRTS
ncbi:type I polyketide synthase [Goodfellowiella coeruleoviolacea]|uniref:type I polyketide synthase n=1 Tax=Goodfellowiella coeruleoviolacea TaxID=334858 RepID=UPI0020A25F96|nr:type I polyketide synthase [Goodfellowiella coeruleoviolacea]